MKTIIILGILAVLVLVVVFLIKKLRKPKTTTTTTKNTTLDVSPKIRVDFVDINGVVVSDIDLLQYVYLNGGTINKIVGDDSYTAYFRIYNIGAPGSVLNVTNIYKDSGDFFISPTGITSINIIGDETSYQEVEVYFGAGHSNGEYTIKVVIEHNGSYWNPMGFFIRTVVLI